MYNLWISLYCLQKVCILSLNNFLTIYVFTDIDECADDTHLCDQICTNTVGSYTCACNLGYLLHYNGTSCHGISLIIYPCVEQQ